MANNSNRGSLTDVDVSFKRVTSGPKLTISRSDLDWAGEQNSLAPEQVSGLWSALASRVAANNVPAASSGSKLDIAQLLWFGGAGIVLLAMGWFMFLVASMFSAAGLLATSVLYAVAFAGLGNRLYFKQNLRVPGGLMFTVTVAMAPIIVFSIMNLAGTTDLGLAQNALILEVATVVAGVAALRFVRFPFLTMPVFTALWLMIFTLMDLMNVNWSFGSDRHLIVSMVFGGILTLVSFLVDRRAKEDYAFWGYFFGVLTFWISMTFLDKGGQAGLAVYFLVNVALMFASVILQRRIFLAAGALGGAGYLMYLAYDIFRNSMMFPLVLSAMGVAVIYLGVSYHKNRDRIESFVMNLLPAGIVKSLPHNRAENNDSE
jgi:hypothetical protein